MTQKQPSANHLWISLILKTLLGCIGQLWPDGKNDSKIMSVYEDRIWIFTLGYTKMCWRLYRHLRSYRIHTTPKLLWIQNEIYYSTRTKHRVEVKNLDLALGCLSSNEDVMKITRWPWTNHALFAKPSPQDGYEDKVQEERIRKHN